MFNNLINLREVPYMLQRMRREPGLRAKVISKLHLRPRARVLSTWAAAESAPSHWWDIPAVQRRWNRLITGDPSLDVHAYVTCVLKPRTC